MADAEQTEIWRKEFESSFTPSDENAFDRHESEYKDLYKNQRLEWMWIGYLMLKNNQKVIELPAPFEFSRNMKKYYSAEEVERCIKSAGYTYTVKESS